MFNEFLFSLEDFGKMCLLLLYTNIVFDLFGPLTNCSEFSSLGSH